MYWLIHRCMVKIRQSTGSATRRRGWYISWSCSQKLIFISNIPRGRYQNKQGDKQFRSRYQAFNLIEQRSTNSQQQNIGYPQQQQFNQNPQQNMGYPQQQQVNQNLQQSNSFFQPGIHQNQQQGIQRKVQVSFFPCPLGCGHTVPWGSLSGCDNFINMTPQHRKDSVDKVRASKCCLKMKGKSHDPADCKSTLRQCRRAPNHNQLICPNQRV